MEERRFIPQKAVPLQGTKRVEEIRVMAISFRQ